MYVGETANSLARTFLSSLAFARRLISRTWRLVSLANVWVSPRCLGLDFPTHHGFTRGLPLRDCMVHLSMREIRFIVFGEPGSKSNSRRVIQIQGSSRLIKSEKALSYTKLFRAQLPELRDPINVPCEAHITIYYASRRPDLDAELLYDLMQVDKKYKDGKGIITNDRLIRRKYLDWGIDKENPRAEILLRENPSLDLGRQLKLPLKDRN